MGRLQTVTRPRGEFACFSTTRGGTCATCSGTMLRRRSCANNWGKLLVAERVVTASIVCLCGVFVCVYIFEFHALERECMYVCMYVCIMCIYVMYVCIDVFMYVRTYVCVLMLCMYVCMCLCVFMLCMYVYMDRWMKAGWQACMHAYICLYICTDVCMDGPMDGYILRAFKL